MGRFLGSFTLINSKQYVFIWMVLQCLYAYPILHNSVPVLVSLVPTSSLCLHSGSLAT